MPVVPATLLPKFRRVRYAIASTGLPRVLMDVASHLMTYRAESDFSFDRRYGTDTAGKVATNELGIANAERQEQAILYLPSPAGVTRWMLDNIGIDHSDYAFVDLGCGKGRVVLCAAQYPFRQVVGVDISQALTNIARRNLELFPQSARRCTNVEIRNGDATQFEFPPTNLLLHLYHPFEPAVTAAVLRQLEESLARTPRKVAVAYLLYTSAVPAVREVFAGFPWLRETRYEHSLLGHYDWLFFSN